MINFYKDKDPQKLPRFFYRSFFAYIEKNKIDFDTALNLFKKIVNDFNHPDFNKFFFNIPDYFKSYFSENEIEEFENVFREKSKYQEKIKNIIFPHVSDEFSLSSKFLKKSFNTNFPKILPQDNFFLMGSCFARNFSVYLKQKGHNVESLNQFEDLNSLGSNSLFLRFVAMKEHEIDFELTEALKSVVDPDLISQTKLDILESLRKARKQISNCTKIIFTLGNVIDFYDNLNNILPKFILMNNNEDVNYRAKVAKKFKDNGAIIRISNFNECMTYMKSIHNSIKTINKNAHIIYSLSPVPLDSIVGIKNKHEISSIEADCISKSILRSVFYEFSLNLDISKENVTYLPSYEIVRWIAPVTNTVIFGNEDAASRHVSNIIINSICDFFYNQSTQN